MRGENIFEQSSGHIAFDVDDFVILMLTDLMVLDGSMLEDQCPLNEIQT